MRFEILSILSHMSTDFKMARYCFQNNMQMYGRCTKDQGSTMEHALSGFVSLSVLFRLLGTVAYACLNEPKEHQGTLPW